MTRKKNRLQRYKRHAAQGKIDKIKQSNAADTDTSSGTKIASGANTPSVSVDSIMDAIRLRMKSAKNAGSRLVSVDEIKKAWKEGICVHCGSPLKDVGLFFMQAKQSVKEISVSISILARKNGVIQILEPGRTETEDERVTTIALGSLQCALKICENQMGHYLDEIQKAK